MMSLVISRMAESVLADIVGGVTLLEVSQPPSQPNVRLRRPGIPAYALSGVMREPFQGRAELFGDWNAISPW
jgi:hypothetical protein